MMTEEDIVKIKKFVDIRNRGLYASGQEVTDVYNRVLNKNLRPTNCGSCIKQRINELEVVLRTYEKVNNEAEQSKPSDNVKERMAKVRAARGKKKKEE